MISTYLTLQEADNFIVQDKDVLDLLNEVNSHGFCFRVEEKVIQNKTLWKKLKPKYGYNLYSFTKNDSQVINFCLDHAWSINTFVSRAEIINYFNGILTGVNVLKNNQP